MTESQRTSSGNGAKNLLRDHPFIIIATLVIALAGASAAWVNALKPSKSSGSLPENAASPNTTSLAAVSATWPVALGCDAGTSVALPSGLGDISNFHSNSDIRATLIQAGGGAWQHGHLTLDISPAGNESIEILSFKPHILRMDLPAPAWVYGPEGGCGGQNYRTFRFDLDTPSLTDAGVPQDGGEAAPNTLTAALGPDFILSGSQHAAIMIDAQACWANYEWTIAMEYEVAGDTKVRVVQLGDFTTYATGNNTVIYGGDQDSSGRIRVNDSVRLTGRDPHCYKAS